MVMSLVLLTFVVFIALDYFVFSKQRAGAEARAPGTGPALGALAAVRQAIPAGISLQPTFTWSRSGPAGEIYLGVHPMLVGLIGDACEFEFLEAGQRVGRGEPLVRLAQGGHRLTVRSPIAGRVEQVNRQATGETAWRDLEEDQTGWLYRIRPEAATEGSPGWLRGESAAEWTRRQYGELRSFLHDTLADGHLGFVMADGGELPGGILKDLDESVWAALDARFLSHAG